MNGLYLVTDEDLCLGRPLSYIVEEAVKGGVKAVQLREKKAGTRAFIETGFELKEILAPYKVPLIVNDRLDVALAIEAEGLHIGQSDMPYPIARKLMGKEAIIGLSVETMEQLHEAEAWDVDYLGVGTIYPTPTKQDTLIPWGLAGLKKAVDSSRHPIVAIGGINARNLPEIIETGAHSAAVVSAICSAQNPQQTAAEMATSFKL